MRAAPAYASRWMKSSTISSLLTPLCSAIRSRPRSGSWVPSAAAIATEIKLRVRVPTGEEEALRDVVRAREAVRGDLMRARQRLSKLLLRHDIRYEDTASAWTVAHRSWLTSIDLGERGAQVTLIEYLGQVDAIVIRRDALEKIDRRADPRLAVGADRRAAAVSARDRHALGGRPVRRGRRV